MSKGSGLEDAPPLARFVDVTVRFGSSIALNGVSLQLRRGMVHAVVGENGAGKSTLVNLLTCRLTPTSGQVEVRGHSQVDSPRAALEAGIAAVYQDRKLAPNLTALENIFLGREPRTRLGLIRREAMKKKARAIIRDRLGFSPAILACRLGELAVPEQEAVAIAKALLAEPRILALDEPSEALSAPERERLFELVASLRDQGLAILYITHALNELARVADVVTILRDGRVVGEGEISEFSKEDVVWLMIGERLAPASRASAQLRRQQSADVLLSVRGLTTENGRVRGASLQVAAHEVVGVVGLEGSGRRELLRAIMGLTPTEAGTIAVNGSRVRSGSPRQAWKSGIAFVSGDRQRDGLLPGMSVSAQISFASLPQVSRAAFVRRRLEQGQARAIGERLRLRTSSYSAPIESLSGGNQQKTVVGRALAAQARLWLLEDPTAAIDVKATADLHEMIREFSRRGGGVLISSSDASELVPLCDRVLVMVEGRIADDVTTDRLTEAALIYGQYRLGNENVGKEER